MPRANRPIAALLVGLALACTLIGGRAEERSLGNFRDWRAVEFGKGGEACMSWSQPAERSGAGGRDAAFVFVTHRPKESLTNRVNLEVGYTMAAVARVQVTIDDRRFDLAGGGTMAWTRNAEEDRALIAAMRAGRTMRVEGTTKAGAGVRDSYSLLGFTAAYNAIGKACGVR